MEQKILAWHFIHPSRTLEHDATGLTVEPGFIYSADPGPLVICERGMHASRKALDGLQYAPSANPWVCRVRCWGDVQEGSDKLVCRHREVLWMADASRTLHQFACWCVRETPLLDGRKVWDLLTDPRSRRAVEAKEAWLEWKATSDELNAARGAARDAAWGAARGAARGAQQSQLDRMLSALKG